MPGRSRSPTAGSPQVHGLGRMAGYNILGSGFQRMYLAQIDQTAAGKTIEIDLFDPGDVGGDAFLRVLSPDGNAYNYATFNYSSDANCVQRQQRPVCSATGVTVGPDREGRLELVQRQLAEDPDPPRRTPTDPPDFCPAARPSPAGGRSNTRWPAATTRRPGRSTSWATRSTWSCRNPYPQSIIIKPRSTTDKCGRRSVSDIQPCCPVAVDASVWLGNRAKLGTWTRVLIGCDGPAPPNHRGGLGDVAALVAAP